MREIKFRAWDKTSKKMGMVQVRQMLIPDENNENGLQELSVSQPLMQYTGLKDKNGKEIYEGDIVRLRPNVEPDEENLLDCYENYQVIYTSSNWDLCGFAFQGKFGILLNPDGDSAEVIGNIYENPELLPDS